MKQKQIEETALDDMGIVCLHGKTPRSCKVLVRGERVSLIGMTSAGIPDLHVVRGGVDGDEF